jgi:ABC-type polysaccharide/polyol phosphate export permease
MKKANKNNYRYLVYQFTITDFKLRYSHSVLGYLWSLLNPLLMFGVLYVVFSVFMRFGAIEHYQVYLLSGIMLWSFFAETSSSGMLSLLQKSSLLTICLNMIVLSIFIALSRVEMKYSAFFAAVIVIELIILSLGVSLLLSSLYLKFRDLSHIWTVILQLGFWTTPIIYPVSIVPAKYHIIFKINPIARLIDNFRITVISGQLTSARNMIFNFIIVAFIFCLGLFIFLRRQRYFAEWV